MINETSQFFAILTNVGAAKQANADALGIPWKLTEMGVGDANGTDPIPSPTQTSLINEWRRRPLNQLLIDPLNPAVLIAEQVIPAEEGGYWIREIGLYDADGDLVAVANCAPSFKPVLSQGSGRVQIVRMNFIVNSTGNITLKIDPSVVLATREYVDKKILEELYKLDNKQSVRAATTADIVLSAPQTIDGVNLLAGDRVLVKNQTAAKDNGIYIVGVGPWQRAPDADSSSEVTSALILSVEQGSTQADTRWQLITDGAIVLGTTVLTFQNVTQGFAAINSPAFQGSPTAPTAPLSNSSQLLANTAFVQRALGNHSSVGGINASVVLTATAFGQSFMINSTSPVNITLPLASTGFNGGTITFTNVSSGAATILLQGTDYVAGMAAGQLVLKTMDTITLSTGAGITWYAEDGSVRDVLSTAFRDLMSGKMDVGQFGVGLATAPTLPTFKAITPSGLYRALGSTVPNDATPGAPPESGNRLIGVLAITPRNDATYFLAFVHGANSQERRVWLGQYSTPPAELYWSYLMTDEFQASQQDAETGTNTWKWMSPIRVFQAIAAKVVQATESVLGIAKVATQTQTNEGTDDTVMVTPKKLRWGVSYLIASNGYLALPVWLGSFIVQWGTATITTNSTGGTATVSLPYSYPRSHFGATGNHKRSAVANDSFPVYTYPTSLSTLTLTLDAATGAGTPTGAQEAFYISVGN